MNFHPVEGADMDLKRKCLSCGELLYGKKHGLRKGWSKEPMASFGRNPNPNR